jgi:fructose-bisphosphate aldolase class I
MVISGKNCKTQASVDQVAEATLRALKNTVPPSVPGIVFLSGGQSDELATAHLDAINRLGPLPWRVSFSYGRALQSPALEAWAGKRENLARAQKLFHHRARCNGAATNGKYTRAMEAEVG